MCSLIQADLSHLACETRGNGPIPHSIIGRIHIQGSAQCQAIRNTGRPRDGVWNFIVIWWPSGYGITVSLRQPTWIGSRSFSHSQKFYETMEVHSSQTNPLNTVFYWFPKGHFKQTLFYSDILFLRKTFIPLTLPLSLAQ